MAEELGSYQILGTPQDVKRKRFILGSVISSERRTNPFDDYFPYPDDPKWGKDKTAWEDYKTTMEFFWKPNEKEGGESVKLKDVLASRRRGSQDEGQLKMTQALQGHVNRATKKDCRIEAGNVEQYTIDNAGGALRTRLSQCQPWMSEIQALYESDSRKDPTYYIITGVYTCSNIKVTWSDEQSSGVGGEAKLPGDVITTTATGGAAPPGTGKALDMGAKLDHNSNDDKERHATIEQEIIFALRYHILDLDLEPSKQPVKERGMIRRFFLPKRTNSGGMKPAIKTVKLGKPVQDPSMITAFGAGGDYEGLFYWKEPVYAVPDDGRNRDEPEREPNGVAH